MPMDVKEGDRVLYSKYAGTEIEVAGEPHLILKVDDVIGMLAGDDIAQLKPLGAPSLLANTADRGSDGEVPLRLAPSV